MKRRQPTEGTGGATPKLDANRVGARVAVSVEARDIGDENFVAPDYQPNLNYRDDPDESVVVPIVTRMPDGYEVVEHRVGRAIGQWVLQLRCQCGRRWFELETVEATNCPRCGLLVYVEIRE